MGEAPRKAVWYGRTNPCDDPRGPRMRSARDHARRCQARDGFELIREYLEYQTGGLTPIWERPVGRLLRADVPELTAAGVTLLLVNNWRDAVSEAQRDALAAEVAGWGWEWRSLAIGEQQEMGGWRWKPAVGAGKER